MVSLSSPSFSLSTSTIKSSAFDILGVSNILNGHGDSSNDVAAIYSAYS